MFNKKLVIIFALFLFAPSILWAQAEIKLGEPLTDQQLKPFDITVFPDGKNLPQGSGSVSDGKTLYNNQCRMCHGEEGIEGPAARLAGDDGWFSVSDPLRALRIKDYPVLLISVGGMWPHATSIFDYVRRAMPHFAPKSLTDDEVYALTAYILHLNGFIDEKESIDKSSILSIEMPGKSRNLIDASTQKMLLDKQ